MATDVPLFMALVLIDSKYLMVLLLLGPQLELWSGIKITTDTSAYNAVFWAGTNGGTPNVVTVVDPGFNGTDGSVINLYGASHQYRLSDGQSIRIWSCPGCQGYGGRSCRSDRWRNRPEQRHIADL